MRQYVRVRRQRGRMGVGSPGTHVGGGFVRAVDGRQSVAFRWRLRYSQRLDHRQVGHAGVASEAALGGASRPRLERATFAFAVPRADLAVAVFVGFH